MARPREFDRDEALEKAMEVFWSKGFAATSTDDLLKAMGLGRQSFYNAFGDKRRMYLEALDSYQQRSIAGHLQRLAEPASGLAGIKALLAGVIAEDEAIRSMGCMGVGSVGEFGASDPELTERRRLAGAMLGSRIADRIREGQADGSIEATLDPVETAGFVQMAMTGLQLAARAGGVCEELRSMAAFTADRLRSR